MKVALLHNRPVTRGITAVVGLATSSTVNVALIQGEAGGLAGWLGECRECREIGSETEKEGKRVAESLERHGKGRGWDEMP